MPERAWHKYAPIGVGLGLFILIFGVPTLVQEYQGSGRTEESARQEYEQSKRIAPFGPTTEGEHANPEAYRDEWRAERDLRAQNRMATWAIVMGLATVAGVILLTATLRETWRAGQSAAAILDQTRRQADIAESTAKRQLRAYVSTVEAIIVFEHGHYYIRLVVANTGQTPVIKQRIGCCAKLLDRNVIKDIDIGDYPLEAGRG